MSVYTANGATKWASGQEAPDLIIPLVSGDITLTNELQAAGFIGANNGYIFKADLLTMRQIRLTGRVKTVSASVNTPIAYVRYSTSFTTTVGSYSVIAASGTELSFSMFTGQTFGDTGWVNIAPLAQINDCFLGLFTSGGDGVADPVLSNIQLHLR